MKRTSLAQPISSSLDRLFPQPLPPGIRELLEDPDPQLAIRSTSRNRRRQFVEEVRQFVNEHFDSQCDEYFSRFPKKRTGHIFEFLCKLDVFLAALDRLAVEMKSDPVLTNAASRS